MWDVRLCVRRSLRRLLATPEATHPNPPQPPRQCPGPLPGGVTAPGRHAGRCWQARARPSRSLITTKCSRIVKGPPAIGDATAQLDGALLGLDGETTAGLVGCPGCGARPRGRRTAARRGCAICRSAGGRWCCADGSGSGRDEFGHDSLPVRPKMDRTDVLKQLDCLSLELLGIPRLQVDVSALLLQKWDPLWRPALSHQSRWSKSGADCPSERRRTALNCIERSSATCGYGISAGQRPIWSWLAVWGSRVRAPSAPLFDQLLVSSAFCLVGELSSLGR